MIWATIFKAILTTWLLLQVIVAVGNDDVPPGNRMLTLVIHGCLSVGIWVLL